MSSFGAATRGREISLALVAEHCGLELGDAARPVALLEQRLGELAVQIPCGRCVRDVESQLLGAAEAQARSASGEAALATVRRARAERSAWARPRLRSATPARRSRLPPRPPIVAPACRHHCPTLPPDLPHPALADLRARARDQAERCSISLEVEHWQRRPAVRNERVHLERGRALDVERHVAEIVVERRALATPAPARATLSVR